ncbi:hypothetical protein RF55_19286 [Lasius niger]|uniref:CCHC-type domain-containing protein n=1 Tax=Lasius niger TaxID=67767 RepID=A0A0J7K070_LASNI|nr:hypothetical protein RF55_19286 [Lasius niger]
MEAALKKQTVTAGLIERFWDITVKIGKDKLTRPYLVTRLQLLETYWARFMEGHDAVLVMEKFDDSDYAKNNVFATTEDHFVAAKSRITSFINQTKTPESQEGEAVLRQIQLPKINLPTFSGDQLAWEPFRDLFKSFVHDVKSLSSIQKLQYLRASLAGEAAVAVANMEMTSEGYSLAWDELSSRYDNRRVLLSTYMRALLSAAPISKPSAAEINRLISVVNQASRSFKAMGRPVKFWDDWFVHILVDKLDSASRLLWESSLTTSQEFPTFNDLKDFLLTRGRALDAANPRTTLTTTAPKSKRGESSGKLLSHATSTDTNDNGSSCPLCRERHALRACAKFKALSAEQRREHVRKKKTCFNCLGQGHVVSACPSSNRCRQCGDTHHSLLHLTNSEGPTPTTLATVSSESTSSTKKPAPSGEGAKIAALSTSTSAMVQKHHSCQNERLSSYKHHGAESTLRSRAYRASLRDESRTRSSSWLAQPGRRHFE